MFYVCLDGFHTRNRFSFPSFLFLGFFSFYFLLWLPAWIKFKWCIYTVLTIELKKNYRHSTLIFAIKLSFLLIWLSMIFVLRIKNSIAQALHFIFQFKMRMKKMKMIDDLEISTAINLKVVCCDSRMRHFSHRTGTKEKSKITTTSDWFTSNDICLLFRGKKEIY